MSVAVLLPAEFADLERFAEHWVLPNECERNAFRVKQSIEDLDDYYQTVFPRMDAICDYIDQFSLDSMPPDAARLLRLGQMLMEVVPSAEVYRAPDVPNSFEFERFHIISPDDPITIIEN
ncbi:MAG: hypothetical protein AAF387_13675 [Pseudomonadota bacterium]